MADNISTGALSTPERNKKAAINGLVLGLIYIVIVTITFQFATNIVMSGLTRFAGYVIYLVILGFMLAGIRKANGGYIELREAFGAAFVTFFVAGLLSFAYQQLYVYVIDPGFTDRVINASIAALEQKNIPDDQMDKMIERIEESKKVTAGGVVMGFLAGIIVDCLFGLLVSLIIKKPRPIFEPM